MDRRPHRLIAFFVPLFLLGTFNSLLFANSPKEAAPTKPVLKLKKPVVRVGRDTNALGQPHREISQIEGVDYAVERVKAGDTPIKILHRLGIPHADREGWRWSVQRHLPN